MNKIARTLTMTGLGLLASAAIGAPALAADGGTHAGGKSSGGQVQQFRDRDEVRGWYRTLGACRKAGYIGEAVGKFDNARCYPVRVGIRRGLWVLKADDCRSSYLRTRSFGHVRSFDDRVYVKPGYKLGGTAYGTSY
ncbi:hypothetical protein AB0M02_08250 [Actinoplanes sp. NPDC051861]|uniref:hypothetical protein n=1 Tax=Actinoplanes sp. NPDC051861 TaxID=3155170 RepID=UPI0034458933